MKWRGIYNLKKSPEETFSDVSYRHFGPDLRPDTSMLAS